MPVLTPAERQRLLDEFHAAREKMRDSAVAQLSPELGPPTEPICRKRLCDPFCANWKFPNGVELHIHTWHDGPSLMAASGPEKSARCADLTPEMLRTTTSIREWLASVGLLPPESEPLLADITLRPYLVVMERMPDGTTREVKPSPWIQELLKGGA